MTPAPTTTAAPPLRVGVVGTAHWARTVHAAGAVAAEQADLVALWGRTPEKVAPVAERYSVTAADSFDALLEQVDVVTFAVPPQVQPELAARAARAGKHLLLEKPVATSVEAADEVATALAEGGGRAAVFFTRRYVPEIEQRLHEVAQESWGAARVVWHAHSAAEDSPYRDSVWRTEPLAALWDLTPHVLAHLVPVLGAVEEVTARRGDHGVELRTQHASGAHADVSVSLRCPDYVEDVRLLRADGSEVSLTVPPIDAAEPFARALDQLVTRTRGGDEGPDTWPLALEVTRVLAEAEAQLL